MTKKNLIEKLEELQKEKGMSIDGVGWNSRKDEIQNAIDCLECPDDLMDKYFIVLSLKYENIGRTIAENDDFKHHSYNRMYVYNTAKQILA